MLREVEETTQPESTWTGGRNFERIHSRLPRTSKPIKARTHVTDRLDVVQFITIPEKGAAR